MKKLISFLMCVLLLLSGIILETAKVHAEDYAEDYNVKFKVTFVPHRGSKVDENYDPGETIYVDFAKYIRVDIVPIFNGQDPLYDSHYDTGEIFYWPKWLDSTNKRPDANDNKEDFEFGDKIQTIRISESADCRYTEKDEYYYIHFEGKEVSSGYWGPHYDEGDKLVSSYDGNEYRIYVEEIISLENLAYISASNYDWFIENKPTEYGIKEIYPDEKTFIDDYLIKVFGENTGLESDNYEYEKLPIHWKLKEDTEYTSKPGQANTFVWWIEEKDFDKLGWTNDSNIPLNGELAIKNIDKVDDPVISPAGGDYNLTEIKNVTIMTNTEDATIYYTTDGSDPKTNGTSYTGPFAVKLDATVKAVAIKDSMADSDIVSVTYRYKKDQQNFDDKEDSDQVYDPKDKNDDGVITCEELLGKYWNWDEASKSCIYTKQVTDSIIVNTSTK